MNNAAIQKSPDALRTISEASEELGVPQHVLRFWEDKFSALRPMKRAGGRRYYRPEDLALLKRIQTLLHDEGYTIKGVQKLMKQQNKAEFLQGEVAPALQQKAANMAATQLAASAQQASTAPKAATSLEGSERKMLEAALADLQTLRAKLAN